MPSDNDILQAKLELLPALPGVYLFKNQKGDIIYVGKAVNLRNRVRNYFNNRGADNHLASHILRDVAHDLEWVVTQNEIEALILEANLAKKHAPRYNIELKDDKHYPYLRITLSEPFPRLLVTRHVAKDGDAYFGPYTNAKAMRKTLQLLQGLFRIRDCDLKLPLAEAIRPCLSHHLGRCDAPCAFAVTEAIYRAGVDEAMLMLRGKRKDLMQVLQRNMQAAAEKEQFEEAARIRDHIRNLEAVQERQRVDLGTEDEPKDLIAVARMGKVGCITVLEVRDGFVNDRKIFEVNIPLEQDEGEILTEFLRKYYIENNAGDLKQEIPREIALSHALPPEENMEALLRELRGKTVNVEVPQRGEKARQLQLALANAKMQLTEFVIRRERKNRQNYLVTALQEDLGLPQPPNRIEGFDISHLSGTDTVASQVVFIDGKPAKKEYRHYNVKTVEGIDDFASMREVLSRRGARINGAGREEQQNPDLILIDGGKGQLRAAHEVLREQGLGDIPMIGLAKRLEEIFFPGQSEPLLLPKTSASLKLLQAVRDEAHRFAITFQRSKRGKYLTTTWLDSVAGLGEKTKTKLLQTFGSPKAVQEADETELVKAIGKARAAMVIAARATGDESKRQAANEGVEPTATGSSDSPTKAD
jgi:excinuclease ABC subunit C